MSAIRMLLGCYQDVMTMLQEFYKAFTRMLLRYSYDCLLVPRKSEDSCEIPPTHMPLHSKVQTFRQTLHEDAFHRGILTNS